MDASSIPKLKDVPKFEDVGGLSSLKEAFHYYISMHIQNQEAKKKLGLITAPSILLYGAPGCGKTLIVKAFANEIGANFIHIKGNEVYNKYHAAGNEQQNEVENIFWHAKACAPCVIFFDHVHALILKKGTGDWVAEKILSQMMTGLDDPERFQLGVYVVGATKSDLVDLADNSAFRFERFSERYYVPLPSANERALILQTLLRKKHVSPNFDHNAFACKEECKNLTGQDLSNLVNIAAKIAQDDKDIYLDKRILFETSMMIETPHFEKSIKKIIPILSEKEMLRYKSISSDY